MCLLSCDKIRSIALNAMFIASYEQLLFDSYYETGIILTV